MTTLGHITETSTNTSNYMSIDNNCVCFMFAVATEIIHQPVSRGPLEEDIILGSCLAVRLCEMLVLGLEVKIIAKWAQDALQ